MCSAEPVIVPDVSINEEFPTAEIGETIDLVVTAKNGGNITWSYEDYMDKFMSLSKIVTASGEPQIVTIKGNGYGELTATDTDGHSITCYLTAGTGISDPDAPVDPGKPKQQSNATMPTWSWFAIGGGSALLIAGVVLLIIFLKKKPV